MTVSGQSIEKLVKKCREGNREACQEVKDYRKWVEGIYNCVLMFTLCNVLGQILIHTFKPVILEPRIFVTMMLSVVICIGVLVYLEKLITKLYQIITDPVMNFWPVRILYLTALAISIYLMILTVLEA